MFNCWTIVALNAWYLVSFCNVPSFPGFFSRYNFFDFHLSLLIHFLSQCPEAKKYRFCLAHLLLPSLVVFFLQLSHVHLLPGHLPHEIAMDHEIGLQEVWDGTAKINIRLGLKAEQCEDHLASEHSSQFCHRANCFHKRFLWLTHFCKLLLLLTLELNAKHVWN